MNCPHCNKLIHGWTGYDEARKLQKHLPKCRKHPRNLVITDGQKTVICHPQYGLMDALEERSKSRQ